MFTEVTIGGKLLPRPHHIDTFIAALAHVIK